MTNEELAKEWRKAARALRVSEAKETVASEKIARVLTRSTDLLDRLGQWPCAECGHGPGGHDGICSTGVATDLLAQEVTKP